MMMYCYTDLGQNQLRLFISSDSIKPLREQKLTSYLLESVELT